MDIPLARGWIATVAAAIAEQADQLTQLDSAIGDADHGVNMNRGFTAVAAALADYEAATVGRRARQDRHDAGLEGGRGVRPAVRHARSGPSGKALDGPQWTLAAARRRRCGPGWRRCRSSARAAPGDKTMVDAYAPGGRRLREGRRRRRRPRRGRRGRRGRAAQEGMRATIADAGPQGPGLLPRPAQRRPPGPGRDLDLADLPRAGRGDRVHGRRASSPDE